MITFEQAKKYNDRVLWDCILSPFRKCSVNPDPSASGASLIDGLDWAFKEVEVPKLIILPWAMARTFDDHQNKLFWDNKGPQSWSSTNRPYRPSYNIDRTHGFMGTYKGIEILACGLTSFAWITSEADPSLIGGDNTVFLVMAGSKEDV